MITQRILCQVLQDIEYNPGRPTGFRYEFHGGDFLIQHWQLLPDLCEQFHDEIVTSELTTQKGRKYYISRHMCISELVQTCLVAIKAFEEHEVRENFKYKGNVVFGPHIDIEAMRNACVNKDKRTEPEGNMEGGFVGDHLRASER